MVRREAEVGNVKFKYLVGRIALPTLDARLKMRIRQ